MGLWFIKDKVYFKPSYCENSVEMLNFLKEIKSRKRVDSSVHKKVETPLLSHCCVNGKYWDNMNSSMRFKAKSLSYRV